MKSKLSFLGIFLLTATATAQTSFELTCRAKAKEVAAHTYSNCVIESRNSKVEEIRSNYQKELSALKSKYDKELEKIGGGNVKSSNKGADLNAQGTEPATNNSKSKANPKAKLDMKPGKALKSDLARKLPGKATTPLTEAVNTQSISDENKVISINNEKATEGLDESSTNSVSTELVEMPIE